MDFFKHFDWSGKSIAKVAAVLILGLVVISIAVSLVGFSVRTVFQSDTAYDRGGYAESMPMAGKMMASDGFIPPINQGGAVDQQAENYEVKTVTVNYRTNKREETCAAVRALKSRKEVVFEFSDDGDESCNYRFKVIKEQEKEVTDLLRKLKPEYFSEQIETIQKSIVEVEDQLSILRKKLDSIESTIADAQKSYDELMALATRKENIDALAKLIDTKLNIINKLSDERTSINDQIQQYAKQRSELQEKLKYTSYNVVVTQDLYFDWKQIAQSWKEQTKMMIQNFNDVLQALSVGLVTFFIRAIQGVVYLAIAIGLLRLVWAMGKKIWAMGGKR